MELLNQRLGPHATADHLADLDVEDTLQYDPYEDEQQNAESSLALDEEPEETLEWGTGIKKQRYVS